MNVIYAPRALRDLQSIGAYLIERSPSGAANVFAAIKSTIDALGFFRRSAVSSTMPGTAAYR